MKRIPIAVAGPSYDDVSRELNGQETVNLYLRAGGPGGKARVALVETPGLVLETVLPGTASDGVRGLLSASIGSSDVVFAVFADKLYEISKGMGVTELGTLDTATGPVQLVFNGNQLLVVECRPRSVTSKAYLYDTTINAFVDLMNYGSLAFTSGGAAGPTDIAPGDVLTGASSGAMATVLRATVTSGAWASGDAIGTLIVHKQTGTFAAETINSNRASDIANVAGDTTDESLDFSVTTGGILNGRFLLNANNTDVFAWSEVLDGLDWPGTNRASAEVSPDFIVALAVHGNALWLFGSDTTEVWTPTGDYEAPFQRISGAAIGWGCAAPLSVALFGNTLVWLAHGTRGKGLVVQATGYSSVQPISTPALAAKISRFSTVSDARAWSREVDGYEFFEIVFPTEDRSYLYSGPGGWSDTGRWNTDTGRYERTLAGCFTYSLPWGVNLVGSRRDGTLYKLDPTAYTYAGERVRRSRITPTVHANGATVSWLAFELDVQAGTGTLTEEAVWLLSWSDDGGSTWSNDHAGSAGKIGERNRRVRWTRLGSSRERIFRVSTASLGPVRIFGAYAIIEVADE